MTKYQIIALFLGTVSCKASLKDGLYGETSSSGYGQTKEFTMPQEPKGQKVYSEYPGDTSEVYSSEKTKSAPKKQDKSFAAPVAEPMMAASPEPMMAAAPISAPMEEGNAWGDDVDTSILDMVAPYIMEDEAYAEAKSMTPEELASMAMDVAGIDSLEPQDLVDTYLPPNIAEGLILDDLNDPAAMFENASEWIDMPGDMDFKDLTDPVYYQDQATAAINDVVDIPTNWQIEDMREDFRDYMGWAIMGDVWDSREASTCADRCNQEYDMCCVQVSMQDQATDMWNYESYCMYQEAIMGDYDMDMMGYKLEMKCDKDSVPIQEAVGATLDQWMNQSAVRMAGGALSAAIIFSSIY